MFHDLKDAWVRMLRESTIIADNKGLHITFPEHLFRDFEREFNISFIEEEDDVEWRAWQNDQPLLWDEEDYEED